MIEIKSKNEIYVDKRNRAPRTGVQGSDGELVRGSRRRKIDLRWALIQENEKDLIFVDENEIIYPKRIHADKGVVIKMPGFQTDARL